MNRHSETFGYKGRDFPVKKTGAPSKTIDGVQFDCYRTGISRYEWRSPDGRITYRSNYAHSGYNVRVDGQYIEGSRAGRAKDFRTIEAAVRAALKLV